MYDPQGPLSIDYNEHDRVIELIDVIQYCVESVSIEFARWDEPRLRGPGLYFVVVSGSSVEGYADPMGDNRWPVEDCPVVSGDIDSFYEAAAEVAVSRDGAVVVSVDGVLLEQMVRFRDLTSAELSRIEGVEEIQYADWMGARHMSAADTSAREEVVAAMTLSEEDGRVTVFEDGAFQDFRRENLGEEWRGED